MWVFSPKRRAATLRSVRIAGYCGCGAALVKLVGGQQFSGAEPRLLPARGRVGRMDRPRALPILEEASLLKCSLGNLLGQVRREAVLDASSG